MNDLNQALREALAATAEIDPRSLDGADVALWHRCDQRSTEIIEALIERHDECGAVARALIQRIARGG